jgi:hypothetical protein
MVMIKVLNMGTLKTARCLQYIGQFFLGSSEQNSFANHSGSHTNHINAIYLQNTEFINLLKPTGYVMHQQFNIQQLYAQPTLYLCVLYLSENKQRLVPLTS